MLIYEIIVTSYYVIYYNIMVNIPMCYSNSTIVNKGDYKTSYRVCSPYIYMYLFFHMMINLDFASEVEPLLGNIGSSVACYQD
jgi:hypothetical protein